MGRTTKKEKGRQSVKQRVALSGYIQKLAKALPLIFFIGVWAVLSTYESAQLFRINELSVFLFDDLFFEKMMTVPAGMLRYVSSFLVQFFYYPALGAAIYVSLLYAVYRLVIKVFELPKCYRLLALLPVVALLASNTQLGYWIFYLKQAGYYYMALLATLLFLLALLGFKRLNEPLRMVAVAVWCFAGYPLLGAYALVQALLMGCYSIALAIGGKRSLLLPSITLLVAVVAVVVAPQLYYGCYTSVAQEYIYGVGLPVTQWSSNYVKNAKFDTVSYWHWIHLYWIPFILLLLSLAGLYLLVAMRGRISRESVKTENTVAASVALFSLMFLYVFWYNDVNFRVENKQNNAMWEGEWRKVADYARETPKPTRQVVMNKNIALFKLGKAGAEMFTYPDGSSEILAPMGVHLTQTGGKMLYFHFGKLNFSYRWCMEDAVEYGWRVEYLKHAARSMLLSGEYRLAQRYVDILKRTIFYRSWAKEIEGYIKEPSLIEKTNDFNMPLQLSCYPDELGVDESFVEAYLTKNFKNMPKEATPLYLEVAISFALVRKDIKGFLILFDRYLRECNPSKLPKHYQEALLLFLQLDKGKTVTAGSAFVDKYVSKSIQRRLEAFVAKTKNYPGMKEAEMAPYFDDYKDTYFYFYFFVRKIKTN